MKSGIYKITQVSTGRCYIGQSQKLKTRLRNHTSQLRGGKHRNAELQQAFNKTGFGDFSFEILEYCEPMDLDEREFYHIVMTNSFYPVGFNLAPNSQGSPIGVILKRHYPELKPRTPKDPLIDLTDLMASIEANNKKLEEIWGVRREQMARLDYYIDVVFSDENLEIMARRLAELMNKD